MGSSSRALAPADVVRTQLVGRRIKPGEWAFQGVLLGALVLSLAILTVLLADILRAGMPVLMSRGIGFLNAPISSFNPEGAGVYQGIIGSFLMTIFVIVFAIPLGVAAAVYLEEYAADNRINRFINVNIRNLAGVPSIVYGLLGLAIFVDLFAVITGGKTVIAGGLTLAVLVLPIVIITSAEALRAVPSTIREAGYGVGATRWEVIRHHVLPSAAPGILTGTVLALARALGETAPLLLVGAVTGFLASGGASLWEQMQLPFTTMPTVIFQYAGLPNEGFRAVTAAAIIVLLVVILTANAAAIYLRNRFERKW